MQNTHTKTNQPATMSPEWCAGVQQTIREVVASLPRDVDQTTTAVGRIVAVVNTAANQPTQAGLNRVWTGESSLRLWGTTCTELRTLLLPDKRGRKPPLRADDITALAEHALRLFEAAARLYAEVAPALLDKTAVVDRPEVEAYVKLQEFMLNYAIMPTVIELHRGFISRGLDLGERRECNGEAEKLIPLIKQVAEFANRLCKLSEQYAPDSNPYAAMVGDEFTTGHQRIARAEER